MGFGTVLTAMVTPFDTEGNIDFDVTTVLIEDLLANGTEGLVVAGTTGESPTLLDEEKIALFKHVIEVVNKSVQVIAGTSNNITDASILISKEYELLTALVIMLCTTN